MGLVPEFISKLMGGKKDVTPAPDAAVNNGPSVGVTGATSTTGTESGQGANTAIDVSAGISPTTTASSEAPMGTVTTVDNNLGTASPVNTVEPMIGSTPSAEPTPVATGTPDQKVV